MKASIIIPTFNALKYTKLCLYSLNLTTFFPHELIFVDNGSTDGTIEFLSEFSNITLIRSKINLGYAGACNLGIKKSDSDYIVISNNDIFFTPYWLTHLVEASESFPNIGLVGPATNKAAGFHVIPHNAYHGKLDLFAESKRIYKKYKGFVQKVTWLVFFCTLIKRETIENVGILDPNLGLGGCDDVDYSYRVNQSGRFCALARSVYVHHFCSSTYIANKLNYNQLLLESREMFIKKWKGITGI